MSFIVERCLTDVRVGTAAAVALLDVCYACSGRLAAQFDALASQCLHALKLPHRDNEVAVNVLKGAVPSAQLGSSSCSHIQMFTVLPKRTLQKNIL